MKNEINYEDRVITDPEKANEVIVKGIPFDTSEANLFLISFDMVIPLIVRLYSIFYLKVRQVVYVVSNVVGIMNDVGITTGIGDNGKLDNKIKGISLKVRKATNFDFQGDSIPDVTKENSLPA